MYESRKRSLIKTITWRVIAVTNAFAVVYIFTGEPVKSMVISLIANAIGAVFYYFHERAWNLIKWGTSGHIKD